MKRPDVYIVLLTITHASTSRTPEATSNNTTLMLRGESRRKTFTLLRRARKVLGRNSKPKWKRGLPAISTQKGRPPTVDIHTHTRAPEPVISFGKKVTVAAEEEGGYVYRVLHDHAHASKLHTHTIDSEYRVRFLHHVRMHISLSVVGLRGASVTPCLWVASSSFVR